MIRLLHRDLPKQNKKICRLATECTGVAKLPKWYKRRESEIFYLGGTDIVVIFHINPIDSRVNFVLASAVSCHLSSRLQFKDPPLDVHIAPVNCARD